MVLMQNSRSKQKSSTPVFVSIEAMEKYVVQGVYQVKNPITCTTVNISEMVPEIVAHEFDIPVLKTEEFDRKVRSFFFCSVFGKWNVCC